MSAPPGSVVGVVRAGQRRVIASGVADSIGTPVTAETLFDLASVTKVVVTTCLLHRLAVLRELTLDDPVVRYLPWSPTPSSTNLRTLAYHRACLWEWQPLYLTADPVGALAGLPLRYDAESGRHYSDLGFVMLGLVIEAATGLSLRDALTEIVVEPLGLRRLGFGPVPAPVASSSMGDAVEKRMAATGEPYPVLFEDRGFAWRERELVGVANDGNAFHAFGGVAGHAGAFAVVDDLLTLLESLASGDVFWGDTRDVFADGPDAGQAFGWRSMTDGAARWLWHPGFTGCAVGFVPGDGTGVAMLTNRLMADEPEPTEALWRDALAEVSR